MFSRNIPHFIEESERVSVVPSPVTRIWKADETLDKVLGKEASRNPCRQSLKYCQSISIVYFTTNSAVFQHSFSTCW